MAEDEEIEKVPDQEEQELATRIKRRKSYYERRYAKSLQMADKESGYFRGIQWSKDERDRNKLPDDSEKRPQITVNHVRRYVNYLRGRQAESRYYFKVVPADRADPNEQIMVQLDPEPAQPIPMTIGQLSTFLTEEMKKIENENDGEYYLSDCFLDANSGGARSYLEVFVKVDDSVYPYDKRIMFEHRSFRKCFPDPDHKKYDLSDCKDFILLGESSKDDLIEEFPKQEAKIKELRKKDELLLDAKDSETENDNELNYRGGSMATMGSEDEEDLLDDNLIWVKYFDYEYKEEYVYVTNLGVPPQKIPKEMAAKVRSLNEKRAAIDPTFKYMMVKLRRQCWYVTTTISDEYIERKKLEVNGVELTRLPFAEYAPDRLPDVDAIEMRDVSPVRDAISPQDMWNTALSHMIAHVASSAHSGFMYEEGALKNPDDWEDFGSSPGFMGEVKKGFFDKIRSIAPAGLSQAHLTIMQLAEDALQKTLNINPDLLGTKDEAASGKAIALRQNAGQTGTHFYFDNMRRTQHVLARIQLEFICAMRGVDYKKLKVVVDDALESPTARWENWTMIEQLMQKGALESPYGDLIIETMNINNREGWIERWKQIMNLQEREAAVQQAEQKIHAEQMAIQDAAKEIKQRQGPQEMAG